MVIAELFAKLGLQVDKAGWNQGHQLIDGMKKAVVAFLSYEAVKKLGELITTTVDLGAHLDDLRQKTGLSAEALQKWGFAAMLGGSDLDAFAAGVGKMARTMREATNGSADAQKAFKLAGLNATGLKTALNGGSAGLDAALIQISETFASMPNGPKKEALAMEIFGRAGADLIPTLNKGARGLAELKQEAEDLGIVMSGDAVTASKKLSDDIDKLKASFHGLLNQAVILILPYLQEAATYMLEFVKAHKAEIIEKMKVALIYIGRALQYVGRAIQWVIGFIETLIDMLDGIGDVIDAMREGIETAIGAVVVAFLWVADTAEAIGKRISAAFSRIAEEIHWEEIKGKARDAWEYVADKAGRAADWITSKIDSVKDAGASLRDSFYGFFDGVREKFKAVIDWVSDKIDWISNKLNGVTGATKNAITKGVNAGTARTAGYGGPGGLNSFSPDLTPTRANGGAQVFNDPMLYVIRQTVEQTASAYGSTPNVTNTYGDINITTPTADPVAVGKLVQDQIDEHWSSQMRHALAGTGAP